ncbi:MAG TPA: hypothetical protein VKT19_04035 [Steroidobacteraceae bacterium]|nr:hypothetical protein [Steroidobacteraceae bacterium]
MEAAYRRGYESSRQAHQDVSPTMRAEIAAAELSDRGVDELLTRSMFLATVSPPWEVLAEYGQDDQAAFFLGWLDGASGSARFREYAESVEQLMLNL